MFRVTHKKAKHNCRVQNILKLFQKDESEGVNKGILGKYNPKLEIYISDNVEFMEKSMKQDKEGQV